MAFTTFESNSHSGPMGRTRKHLRPHSWRWLSCFNPHFKSTLVFEGGGNSNVSIQIYVDFIFGRLWGWSRRAAWPISTLVGGRRPLFEQSSKEFKGVERTTMRQSETKSHNQNGKSGQGKKSENELTRKELEKTSERISVLFHNKMILSVCNSFTPETRVIEVTSFYAETNI